MLGFIGLGVMGTPMCRNLAAKSGQEVRAFDSDLDALANMDESGVTPAESIRDVAEHADIVFLSLPGGAHVSSVCMGAGSLLTHLKPGGLVVDFSTTPVNLARDLSARFLARGIQFADAPVARTREAAQDGTLSVMVGGPEHVFARIKPLLAFNVLAKGSADSFARAGGRRAPAHLRRHRRCGNRGAARSENRATCKDAGGRKNRIAPQPSEQPHLPLIRRPEQ